MFRFHKQNFQNLDWINSDWRILTFYRSLQGSDGGHGVLHRPRDLQRRECTGAVRVRAGAGSGGAVPLHRNRTHAHRRRDGPLGGCGKLPAQIRRSGRGHVPPDAARPSRRLLPLRGAPRWRTESGLRRALQHLLAVRSLLQIPGGVWQSEALAAAAAHAHLLLAGGSGSAGRRAQKETAQHDSVGGPGVLCQEDLWTVRCMSAMAHAHTRIQILIYAYTHKHTAGRWEALLNTRHWQIHTHTPNKTYGWTDGESDGKTKGGGALSVTLFQRFAFNQLKIERMGGWVDGWMDGWEEGLGGSL